MGSWIPPRRARPWRSACRRRTTRRFRPRSSASSGCEELHHEGHGGKENHGTKALAPPCPRCPPWWRAEIDVERDSMTYRFLLTAREGAIEYLTLNRPEVRNAFNEHVIAELSQWATTTAAEPLASRPRAVVLRGAGQTFCAGADVTWMAKTVRYTEDENVRDGTAMSRMYAALGARPLPLIGRIHGAALGGGAGLAAVCDSVVADEGAIFGFTETKLGILPAV